MSRPRSSSLGDSAIFRMVVLGIGIIVPLIAVVGLIGGFDKTQGGEGAVVRNGGPLDNYKIRQVIEPASALTWTGLWSTSHKYRPSNGSTPSRRTPAGATGRGWTSRTTR